MHPGPERHLLSGLVFIVISLRGFPWAADSDARDFKLPSSRAENFPDMDVPLADVAREAGWGRRLSRAVPLLLLLVGPAHAGAIHGTVRVPALARDPHEFQPYAGSAASLPGHARTRRGLLTDAVLSIEALPPAVALALPEVKGARELAQRDQSFVPRVVSVPIGAEVDFPNRDPIYHNVFSVSPPARFDLGKYPRGQSRRVRFTKVGLVKVFCDIHSDMAAFIVVLPNRAYGRPDADGSYRLPELPAGRYTLTWWHPDFPGSKREVTIPADGDVVADVGF